MCPICYRLINPNDGYCVVCRYNPKPEQLKCNLPLTKSKQSKY